MTWFKLAADLIREAMSSSEPTTTPAQEPPPPADIEGLIGLMNRHRVEIDKNFETLVQMLNAQNERALKAMRIQRRWNYCLLAGLVIVAIFAIASFWRG